MAFDPGREIVRSGQQDVVSLGLERFAQRDVGLHVAARAEAEDGDVRGGYPGGLVETTTLR